MEAPKRKVTSKLSYNDNKINTSPYRPPSPVKSTVSSSATSALRPKAKVNSSATPASARAKFTKPISAVSTRTPTSSIPRPASPTKSYTSASPTISSQKPRVARTNIRPQTSHSTPGTPTPTYLSVEPSESTRNGGSLTARQTSPPLGLGLSNGSLGANSIFSSPLDEVADLPLKIKSKLSRVALTSSDSLSPSPNPSHPSIHSGHTRVRAPSISSSHSLSSNTSTKPEYTLTPSANPHRYTPGRPVEPSYQPFSSPSFREDTTVHYPRIVDPTTIPLPTNSPPTSAVSFSSRSSVSRSSVSYGGDSPNSSVSTNHVKSPSGGLDLRSTLDSLVHISESTPSPREDLLLSPIDDDDMGNEDRKARHEAKVNRKIADLEITNRSLLAINSTLEATKHRQAKEIRELRRKLRESRLILPPHTFRAVTSKDSDVVVLDDEDDDDEDEDEDAGKEDQAYMRIRIRLDEMIESAKTALTTKTTDFMDIKGPTKVLSEEEVRDWREGDGEVAGDMSMLTEVDEDEQNGLQSFRTPSRNTGTQQSEDITSEDEVEAMTVPRDSPSPPPIVVTSST
ncbi:hypothetical protein BDP27DRAFT_88762 [Rhodocollybia butyracea]|uniref:Uncharacterized protein n=1 Tax=Rhodocollybia butyracea TaxID=206335 RepID=A0A9P5Q5D7_9AGAR|nr:hypothetical protein BDP27DRAFT_88762 [Rhodocollybia butyracea]